MKNYGILGFNDKNVENFTSDKGLEIRRMLNPFLRKVFKIATKGDIIVDNYPKLEDDTPYIFVSTHNFVEDTIANLATIDRNAYLLFGTTDQLEINPEMYAAWANGFIYVNRQDSENRKESILKMERVLKSGSSVLIFAEGGFNNTENLLSMRLFASPYILAKRTGCKVVPIAPLHEYGSNKIYMNVGEPIDLNLFNGKEEALLKLRDELATLLYESMCKHATRIKRSELGADPRLDYMEERKNEYLNTKWTKDVWEEELTQYRNTYEREMMAINEDLSNLEITKENAFLAQDILQKVKEKKYDFKQYMHKNWQRK